MFIPSGNEVNILLSINPICKECGKVFPYDSVNDDVCDPCASKIERIYQCIYCQGVYELHEANSTKPEHVCSPECEKGFWEHQLQLAEFFGYSEEKKQEIRLKINELIK